MGDELQMIVGTLSAVAAAIAIVIGRRVYKERRLATQDTIVVSVMTEWKGVVILLAWIAAAVLLCPFLASLHLDGKAGGAFGLVLALVIGFAIAGLGFAICLRLTRNWRRLGELRYAPDRLSLFVRGQQWSLDLRQRFDLCEWAYSVGEGQALQAVVFRQGEAVWGFTYPLAMSHSQFDSSPPVGCPRPIVGADARVIHERLRTWSPSGGRSW